MALDILRNYPLAEKTTFKIGGPADFFCEPRSREDLADALKFIRTEGLRYYVLGGGSNTLFSDAGFRGIVLCMDGLRGVTRDGRTLHVLAGTSLDYLNEYCIKNGLSGLEFSGGLPGSVGGAVYMNARAYDGEISRVVSGVTIYVLDGREAHLKPDQLKYGYKDSVFMHTPGLFIYEAEFTLQESVRDTVHARTEQNRADREAKGQYAYPSAGCAFKNDRAAGQPTSRIIDSLSLKGLRVGGAEIYFRHANFIVNRGGATAADVLRLMEEVEKIVFEKTGIRLEREIRVVE
jgi:UDP-N-acetylmuramate dehydrogenase